ncbi:MAG: hypothetical protein R3E79_60155 [Caldilineaceae bacterium]
MTHSFFTIHTIVSTALDRSSLACVPKVVPTQGSATVKVTRSETGAISVTRRPWLVHGRVRWSTGRVIIEWQTKQATTAGNFAIYRSQKLNGRDATPSIFPSM